MMERETIVKNGWLLLETECHWLRVGRGEEPGHSGYCPLCKEYPGCTNCPICLESGGCYKTPWAAWGRLTDDSFMAITPKAKEAANVMTAYIRQLRYKWEVMLKEFDRKAEKQAEEVYVWLLRDGEIKKVAVNNPDHMNYCLSKCTEYPLDNEAGDILTADTEGLWWFRSERAAQEAKPKWQCDFLDKEIKKIDKAEEPDCLISLREAKAAIWGTAISLPLSAIPRRVDAGFEILDRLPRYPIPKDKPAVTRCEECQNFYNKEDGPRTHNWYNRFCRAAPDPTPAESGEPYAYTRDINIGSGSCRLFSPKGKMVSLEAVEDWLSRNGHTWAAHAIGAGLERPAKD